MAEFSSELELCSSGLTKSFLKVRFLAMAEYSSELEFCSFGLTKSFVFGEKKHGLPVLNRKTGRRHTADLFLFGQIFLNDEIVDDEALAFHGVLAHIVL